MCVRLWPPCLKGAVRTLCGRTGGYCLSYALRDLSRFSIPPPSPASRRGHPLLGKGGFPDPSSPLTLLRWASCIMEKNNLDPGCRRRGGACALPAAFIYIKKEK